MVAESHSRPNVLVVIADDMGTHQLGCHGSAFYETPRIDGLARQGARFDCAYSASPVCSPARAALYTGLHPARLHLTNYIPGTEPANPRLLTPPWRPFLPVEIDTMGDLFKAAGFDTGHFGKWHLAPDYHYEPGRPMDPESQGFDTVTVTRKPLTSDDPENDAHHIDRITDDAIRFMDTPRQRPFLCVVAHNALHRPEMAPAGLLAKYRHKPGANGGANRPVLAAMTELMDAGVGRLIDHLDETDRARDTIVVFTTDHGAFGPSDERKPLRGAKADLYEGGVRVPFVVRWPGNVAAGVRRGPVFGTDLLPTLLDLCGVGAVGPLDGVSLAGTLRDAATQPPERPELCWHFPHYHHLGIAPSGSIRAGRWKLIEWFDRTVGGAGDGPPFELYDLQSDPGEANNLSQARPDVRAGLAARLREWRREVGAQEMNPNPAYDPDDLVRALTPPPDGDPGDPFGE